jgi:hypothetical protein
VNRNSVLHIISIYHSPYTATNCDEQTKAPYWDMTARTYSRVDFLHLKKANYLHRNTYGAMNRLYFPSCPEVYHFHYHFLTFTTESRKTRTQTNRLQVFFASCTQITEFLPYPPPPQTRPVPRLFKTAISRWSIYKGRKEPVCVNSLWQSVVCFTHLQQTSLTGKP